MNNIYERRANELLHLLWETQEGDVDSPLAGVRVDETEECFRKFGRIKIYFPSLEASQPVIEKINDPSENIQAQSCYYYEPQWARMGDPYKGLTYPVRLRNWQSYQGNQNITPEQQRTLNKIIHFAGISGSALAL